MPSLRNYIWNLFIWQPARSGNGQSAKFGLFTTAIKNSSFGRAGGRNSNFASYDSGQNLNLGFC